MKVRGRRMEQGKKTGKERGKVGRRLGLDWDEEDEEAGRKNKSDKVCICVCFHETAIFNLK